MIRCLAGCLVIGGCLPLLSLNALAAEKKPPGVGDTAPGFELKAVDGTALKLSELTKEGPVVLLVLRGFPGYQCPLCRRQATSFLKQATAFRDAGVKVVMVYPGEADDLNVKALEFLGQQKLPEGFRLVLDPGYKFANAWHLRWDAPRETAYPSTFAIDKDGQVTYSKVSDSHGGRSNPEEVLEALAGAK